MATKEGQFVYSPFAPPVDYEPPVLYEKMAQERDVMVAMRDGVKVCVDVYRPDTKTKVPAILSFAPHFKDWQSPEEAKAIMSQPAWSTLWMGHIEAGDTDYLVSRGYAHVIGNMRGIGKSEDGPPSDYDAYDVIEWIAKQPWCDGQVGMMGLSAFGGAQIAAAKQQPPHLKAIFAADPMWQYFQDKVPGGMISSFPWVPMIVNASHEKVGLPGPLPPEKEKLWKEAMNNPDYLMYAQIFNIIDMKGQINPLGTFDFLIDPFAAEGQEKEVDESIKDIRIPVYTGSGWYAFTYKFHLLGAQSLWLALNRLNKDVPKKLMFCGPAHMERPFHQYANEVVRWYDYWIKGIKNGIMDEPKVKFWVEGAEKWFASDDWPVPGTKWKSLYLHTWERLRPEPFSPFSRESYDVPDSFVQMPPTHTNRIQKLRYLTDPLPDDTLVAGPISLTLYASIDQEDTNWIVVLKDVGPDAGRRTARAGEREIPANLPEKELTRGWLKASNRAIDAVRSTPWRPWHPLTRQAAKPVVPGEITEYQIDILPNANMFRRGHRICLEITSMDLPTGTAGYTDVEYIPYHICSSRTTLHNVYHSYKYPSQLLLPIIPASAQRWIE
ncbi:MAG: CocE/NonD family hydrolase [Deltaproteobacteria bacterium]|nr:MAG: CocE/NonD family hydrolase [Deltaproteobacteria bacterium]